MKTENEDHSTAQPGELFPLGALMQLLYQHWRSPALYAATQLGIADVLGDGSQTVAELATATGCHTPSLYRLLRALARIGVFIELDGPRFANSALSQLLRTDTSETGGYGYFLVARRMGQVYTAPAGEQVHFLAVLDAYPDWWPRENSPVPNEDEFSITLLAMIECDMGGLTEGSVSLASAAKTLRNQGHAMANIDGYYLSVVKKIIANNVLLLLDFAPDVFLVFPATVEQPENLPWPDAWPPYVDGNIEACQINGKHDCMMQPGPLVQISPFFSGGPQRSPITNQHPTRRADAMTNPFEDPDGLVVRNEERQPAFIHVPPGYR